MAACWSWITSPVAKSCVYGLCAFCCWGVFPVLTLYSPRSIVWGLFFFSSPSSCYAVSFSSIPCLPVLSTPLSYMYVVYVWTGWWLISVVLVTSDNKGLLLPVSFLVVSYSCFMLPVAAACSATSARLSIYLCLSVPTILFPSLWTFVPIHRTRLL